MIQFVKSVNNQSLYDLCLMAYGSLDLMVKFCNDNGVNDINYVPVLPQVFQYDDTLTVDQKTNNYVYATTITDTVFDGGFGAYGGAYGGGAYG